MIERFIDLTNFQQWVLFYLITNVSIKKELELEINNFCDKTKNSIDINNYDQDMAGLQKELAYFYEEGIIGDLDSLSYTLTNKGELYCFQNLNKNLDKLSMKNIMLKMTSNDIYHKSKVLCDEIFNNYKDIKAISTILIGNPKDTMTRIQVFVEMIRVLSNFSE